VHAIWTLGFVALAAVAQGQSADPAKLGALRTQFQAYVDAGKISGAVTLVAHRGKVVSVEAVGFQDVERKLPMKPDTIFRIASMTKPVTAVGILMLEDDGKLSIDDPVEKHLPEFRGQRLVKSKTADEIVLVKAPRPITLRDLLTHTSGLPSSPPPGLAELYGRRHRTLAEAVLAFSQQPLDFEPGTKWSYCNAGIDTLGRVIEVVSGRSYEQFLQERLFDPLGMRDTCFYPTADQRARLTPVYKPDGGKVAKAESFLGPPPDAKFPLPAGGLLSTAADYVKVCQMLLDRGTHAGRRILSEAAVEKMTRVQTAELTAGFTGSMGFGLGVGVVRRPEGVTEMLSPGTYGHGGAFGTQAWIDPGKQMIFILMIQMTGIGNADGSEFRKTLQRIAVDAMSASK
jgi:CubicO group peptidase (beta-lactamase class C family)